MQDLKADTVRFLTRDESNNPDRDRDAAKALAKCAVDVRHVDGTTGVDVLVHGPSEVISEVKSTEAAGRIENAMREACDRDVRMLQWVETAEADTARPGSGVGDGSGANSPVNIGGKQPKPHWDSQGHGSSQSPAQPGDTQINPPPNPRR